jgi:phage shock protein C
MTQLETPSAQASPSAPESIARIRRSKTDRVIAGVCGGLGRYFGVDALWFRLAFVVLAIGGGAGVLLYLIAWLVIPSSDSEPGVAAAVDIGNKGPMIAGIMLVVAGLVFLINVIAPWFNQFMWPAVLVAAGLALIYTGGRRANK